MNKEYEPLFTPWKIGNVEVKNRIVLCPMGGTSLFGWMKPSSFNKVAADFFLERAKNDTGLIIPGIANLKDMILGKWLYQNPKMFEDLKEYMVEFHKTGAKLFVQLTAGFGRSFSISEPLKMIHNNKFLKAVCKPIIDVGYLCAAPSELPNRWDDEVKCRALTHQEIQDIIYAYARTSKMLKEAGVDGVEVHAVHEGYLLDQFTLKYTNFRKDEYGGSFENRVRFPVEVIKAIKKECGNDFPVSVRYSVISKTKGFGEGALPEEKDNYKEVGRDFEESIKVVKALEEAGCDMLNCDNGTYDAWYWAHPPIYMPNNCNLEDVARLKPYAHVPLVCAGKMQILEASKAIEAGQIDAMGVARQFLTDGAWVKKVLNDEEDDIMPCIRCHNYCFTMAHYKGTCNDQSMSDLSHMARCALNPLTMTGDKYKLKKASKVKSVAIIGAGIAGLEAARVLTLRGHKVKIFEKDSRIAGIYNEAANFDFKEDDKKLIKWYENQVKKLNINIEFNHEIKSIDELSEFDNIIVATGGKAKKLPISGVDYAIEASEYLKNKSVLDDKKKVVVIGGGLTGCEIAYDLTLKGKEVVIVEALQDLMVVKGLCLANTSYLRDYFKLHNVEVHLESKVKEITESSVIIADQNGKLSNINYDAVISSVGFRSNPLSEAKKNVEVIGDAMKVGNLRTVIWSAYETAMKI